MNDHNPPTTTERIALPTMKSHSYLFPGYLAILFLGLVSQVRCQQSPSLDSPSFDASNNVILTVRGDPGTNYAVEASSDLTIWWKLFSGVASNGQTQFTYLPPPDSGARYFRARLDVPLPPLNVTVQPETNKMDLALLTSDRSALLSVTNDNGVIFTLRVPTNAVEDPEAFYMTMVTNLPGLPFAAGELGAVSLTPAGLNLQSAAQLEITFPTNLIVDPRSVAVYAFDEDGSFLRLTLGFADANQVTVPLFTLSGIGCSIATLSEIEQFSQRPVSDNGVNGVALQKLDKSGGLRKQGYPLDDCDPLALQGARMVDAIIDGEFREMWNSLSLVLFRLGFTSNLHGNPLNWTIPWEGNQEAAWHDFYHNKIEPYLLESEHNCALIQVMERRLDELDQYESLFHVLLLDGSTAAARDSLCNGYKNCIDTIDQCCVEKGLGGQASVDAAQAFANKVSKYCFGGPPNLDGIARDCLPTWSGTITIVKTITHQIDQSVGQVDIHEKDTDEVVIGYKSDNLGLTGDSAGAGYYAIQGPLKAFGYFTHRLDYQSIDFGCCATCTHTSWDKAAVTSRGTGTGFFLWHIKDDPNPPLPIDIVIPNAISPGNDLITSAVTTGIGQEIDISSGMTTGPDGKDFCKTFDPIVTPVHPLHSFTGLLSYLSFKSDKDGNLFEGTASSFSGTWETNIVTVDPAEGGQATTTNHILAGWSFNRK
jgi:hypothetical protein